tara:strand:+ start:73 stop:267 length:195 start_codon:yes stop_codon:yes gene_type:complete
MLDLVRARVRIRVRVRARVRARSRVRVRVLDLIRGHEAECVVVSEAQPAIAASWIAPMLEGILA